MGLIWTDDKLQQARDDVRAEAIHAANTDDWTASFEDWKTKVTGDDLTQQLVEVEDVLAELVRKGDAEKIGLVVIAVRDAYAARLADMSTFGKLSPDAMWPDQAAAKALS